MSCNSAEWVKYQKSRREVPVQFTAIAMTTFFFGYDDFILARNIEF